MQAISNLRSQIKKAIEQSERRARRLYAQDAISTLQRYGLLISFLRQVSHELTRIRRFGPQYVIAFFPSKSEQPYCIYAAGGSELKVLETTAEPRGAKDIVRRLSQPGTTFPLLFQSLDLSVASDDQCSQFARLLVNSLPVIVANEVSVLVSNLQVPKYLNSSSYVLSQALEGLLFLISPPKRFSSRDAHDLSAFFSKELETFLDNLRKYAAYEPDYLVSSLLDHDRAIQETALARVGAAMYMLQHRFRNLRQTAEFVSTYFPTYQDVLVHPEMYEGRINDMLVQMEETRWLENILRRLGERPEIILQSVSDTKDVFKSLFHKMVRIRDISATLEEVEVDPSLLPCHIVLPPHELVGEVFHIHLDNAMREIPKPETTDKRLVLQVYESGEWICFELTNYGPSVPPDVLEDLERVVQMRRPQRTGLGVFLSATILEQVGGEVRFKSPVLDDKGTSVTLRFRKYIL